MTTDTPLPSAGRAWVILVVDDEPDVLESMTGLLEQSIPGSEVLTSNSGAQALAMLDRVDLIVADYRMPVMDGIGFLANCMRLRPTATRILMTAFPGPVPELENRARREADVAAFVSKELGPQELIEAVRKVMFLEAVRGVMGRHLVNPGPAVNRPLER